MRIHKIRDIDVKWQRVLKMFLDLPAVDNHLSVTRDGLEMQENAFAVPIRGDRKVTLEPPHADGIPFIRIARKLL